MSSASASASPEPRQPRATVEDGSPSPSGTPAPETAQDKGKGKATEEDWNPADKTLPDGTKVASKAASSEESNATGAVSTPAAVATVPAAAPAADPTNPWQAVWSADSNAWYFWNAKTGEVTWTNPIATATDVVIPEGIDPALAHLLPKAAPGEELATDPSFQHAKFNARTGRFTAQDFQLTPEYVTELSRQRRMNEMYFDVAEWERQRDEDHQKKRKRDEDIANGLIAPSAGSSKKPSKQEMKRFRAKRAEKKANSHAWLRERD